MKISKSFQMMLSLGVVLGSITQVSAQQPPTSAEVPLSMNSKEFIDRKEKLLHDKNVTAWPGKDAVLVVNLSVRECTWLGGSVTYWASCGDTLMKCVAANGREMCIDAVK